MNHIKQHPTTQLANSRQIHLITTTALLSAMITVMTAYIAHIPIGINGGYIHFGDSLIYLAAALLPTPYALAAAAIGGGMADLLTSPVWAPATIIVKMLIVIPFSCKKDKIIGTRNIIAAIFACITTVAGYFLAEMILFGSNGAAIMTAFIASASGNTIQGIGSAVFFVLFGVFLDKAGMKKRFFAQ